MSHVDGITDLELTQIGGTTYLYSADQSDGGLNSFYIDAGGVAVFQDQLGYSPKRGTLAVNQITLANVAGQDILLPAGRYDDRMAIHELGANGDLGTVKILGMSSSLIGGFTNTETVQVAGKTFMMASQLDQSGFRSFRIRDDLSLEYKAQFLDDTDNYIDNISAMASGTIAGRTYVFTASGFEDGVTAWWVGQWGNIKERDSESATSGLAINAPTALDTATVDGNLFLVIGAAVSGSLSVLKVNEWGGLFLKDHEIDNLSTRFGGVAALDTVIVGDRAFVVAGGADDGLSLFELSADGGLHHLTSIADSLTTTLQNISTIAATAEGTKLKIFAAGSERGISQFEVDLGNLGPQITGDAAANTLSGTSGDDLILGYDGDDILQGQDGADRLIDGAGADQMQGQGGADTFYFVPDARMDTVLDFDVAEDLLDLSGFDLLNSMADLTLTQKAYGVLITFGADRFRIEEEGDQLLIADLTGDHFIF